jgi:predicted RNase H-like HicB family nuclease
MQIPILIERMKGNGYLARGGEPLAVTAEGDTQEEALANLREKLQAKLCNGAVLVPLDLPAQAHPLAEFVGMFKDDPWIEEWKKSMKAYRKKRDSGSSSFASKR